MVEHLKKIWKKGEANIMTVKELIEKNHSIGDICIEVRNNGILVKELKIGADAYTSKAPICEEIVKRININTFDSGKDYYNLNLNKIPDSWLELNVDAWSCNKAYRGLRNIHELSAIRIISTQSGSGAKIIVTEENRNNQLVGQMEIADFPEVLP